jgi:hypothetical protein
VTAAILLASASLLRPTWAILFPPFLLLVRTKPFTNRVAAILTGIGAAALLYLLFSYWAAPYPDNFIHKTTTTLATHPAAALQGAVGHVTQNLKLFFSLADAKWFESMQRGVAFLVACSCLAALGLTSSGRSNSVGRVIRPAFLFVAFNLVTITTLNLVLYEIDGSREFRILAPHLLLSLLLLALFNRQRIIVATAVSYAVFWPTVITTYQESHTEHFVHPNAGFELELFTASLANKIVVTPSASPWKNSLLIDVADYTPLLTRIPPGIGINAVMDWKRIAYPLKSSYLLISPEQASRMADKIRLVPLAGNPLRTLYRNLDGSEQRISLK